MRESYNNTERCSVRLCLAVAVAVLTAYLPGRKKAADEVVKEINENFVYRNPRYITCVRTSAGSGIAPGGLNVAVCLAKNTNFTNKSIGTKKISVCKGQQYAQGTPQSDGQNGPVIVWLWVSPPEDMPKTDEVVSA